MALAGLGMIFSRQTSTLSGILILLLLPFIPRVMTESLMVKFKILETLQEIDKKQ